MLNKMTPWGIAKSLMSLLTSIGVWGYLAYKYPQFVLATTAGVYGSVLFVFLIGLGIPFIPNAIESLSNKPNRFRKSSDQEATEYVVSESGCFAKLEPGRVLFIISEGGAFIRCVMDTDNLAFFGDLQHYKERRGQLEDKLRRLGKTVTPNSRFSRKDAQYWKTYKTQRHEKESHPLPFPKLLEWAALNPVFIPAWPIRFLWWVWKRWVQFITNFVFIGWNPWRKLWTSSLEWYLTQTDKNGIVRRERHYDFTNHIRVNDFEFALKFNNQDTQDLIPISIQMVVILRGRNPFKMIYQTNQWESRVNAKIGTRIAECIRTFPVGSVLAAKNLSQSRKVMEEVLNTDLSSFGVEIVEVNIYDVSGEDAGQVKILGSLALARVESASQAELAKGRAAEIREQSKAIEEHGENALTLALGEQRIRAIKSMPKDSTAIFSDNGGGNIDPLKAATLDALKNIQGNTAPPNKNGEK